MNKVRLPRLLIGASGSGCGKTTFTCGLLRALGDAGEKPVSFKCGPDYIDPMFHTEVLNVPSRNLDLFFAEENTVRYLMAKHGAQGSLAVVEGVMTGGNFRGGKLLGSGWSYRHSCGFAAGREGKIGFSSGRNQGIFRTGEKKPYSGSDPQSDFRYALSGTENHDRDEAACPGVRISS